MKFTILTLFPEVFEVYFKSSIMKKAIEKKAISVEVINFRDFSKDKHKKVDDTPYGGGPGLVLMLQPIVDAINHYRTKDSLVVLLDPSGKTLNQKQSSLFLKRKHIILICGHYEGFDERIENFIDVRVSIGDYVLTGGELPAMIMVDFISRQVEGVINNSSLEEESFNEHLLDYPNFTKPFDYNGLKVPDVLKSGNHQEISNYRKREKIIRTKKYRDDLYKQYLKERGKNNDTNK